jgi:hypothetical protein
MRIIALNIFAFLKEAKAAERWASAARTNRRRRQALHERHANCASAACLCFMKGCQEKKQSYLLAVLL